MSCDMSVDSGPESEYNFDDFENQQEKPKMRLRPSSVSRVSLGGVQISAPLSGVGAKPPLKVPNFKSFLKNGADTSISIAQEETKLPLIKPVPKLIKIDTQKIKQEQRQKS